MDTLIISLFTPSDATFKTTKYFFAKVPYEKMDTL